MKLFILVLLTLSLSCGAKSAKPGNTSGSAGSADQAGGGDTAAPVVTATTTTQEGQPSTLTLGADLVLDIPAGAVPAGTVLTVNRTSLTPAGYDFGSDVFSFQPHGTIFASPITVKFRVTNSVAGAVVQWSKSGTTGGYDPLPSTAGTEDGQAFLSAQTSHFSDAFVGAPSIPQITIRVHNGRDPAHPATYPGQVVDFVAYQDTGGVWQSLLSPSPITDIERTYSFLTTAPAYRVALGCFAGGQRRSIQTVVRRSLTRNLALRCGAPPEPEPVAHDGFGITLTGLPKENAEVFWTYDLCTPLACAQITTPVENLSDNAFIGGFYATAKGSSDALLIRTHPTDPNDKSFLLLRGLTGTDTELNVASAPWQQGVTRGVAAYVAPGDLNNGRTPAPTAELTLLLRTADGGVEEPFLLTTLTLGETGAYANANAFPTVPADLLDDGDGHDAMLRFTGAGNLQWSVSWSHSGPYPESAPNFELPESALAYFERDSVTNAAKVTGVLASPVSEGAFNVLIGLNWDKSENKQSYSLATTYDIEHAALTEEERTAPLLVDHMGDVLGLGPEWFIPGDGTLSLEAERVLVQDATASRSATTIRAKQLPADVAH